MCAHGTPNTREFNVNYAGITGIAFNLSTLYQHRWNASVDWSKAIAQTDLLTMCDKRDTVSSTLRAMGLDWKGLSVACDPFYRHPPTAMDIQQAQHAANVKELLTGERPLQLSATPAQTTSKAAGAPPALSAPQPAACACPTRTGYDVSEHVDKSRRTTKTVYLTEPTPAHLPFPQPASQSHCVSQSS